MKYALCITSPEIKKEFIFSMMAGSFEKKLSDMADFGYDGIELLCGYPRDCDHKYVLETCRKNGLEISDVSSGAVFTAIGLTLLGTDRQKMKDCASLFSDMVELAARLGNHIVTIGAFRGWAKDVGSVQIAEEILADLFERLEPKLNDYGMKIALEPVNRGQTDIFNTCAETLSFIERTGSPNIGVLFDTYNGDAAEDDPLSALKKTLESGKLLHFHIADTDRMIPGMGKIDFTSHLRILKDGNYKGYLSGELKSGPDPVVAGKKIIDNMREFEKCI